MKKIFFLSVFLVLIVGCSSDSGESSEPEQQDVLSSEKQIITFRFPRNINAINVNSDGDISNNSIRLFLPPNTDLTTLIPQFSVSSGASAFLDDQEITSGVTTIDFSSSVTIRVVAEDGTSINYTINITTSFPGLDASIDDLISRFNVPGVQLAIIKDEQLVYRKSFGFADEENNVLVNDESLFRIASVSKPITAIGIFKLAENGLLNLDDTVFGANGILETDFGTLPYSNGIEQITVRHLLEHTSGWTNNPYDPMFVNLNFTHNELISDLIDNRPLEDAPGGTFYYSNFGYSVLGRIIEKVSNQSYEDYIKQNVLAPSGINNMEIARNTIDEQHPNEVIYYDQEGFSPYALNVTRMDSHGGWVASATDLAKFLSKVDRNSGRADLVGSNFLQELYFEFQNWVFYGSLPGTSTGISRVNDTFSYVILVNTRTIPVDSILEEMNSLMTDEILNRSEWPSYDLF